MRWVRAPHRPGGFLRSGTPQFVWPGVLGALHAGQALFFGADAPDELRVGVEWYVARE